MVSLTMRSLAEMACQFDEPFTLDTSKYESAFGPAGTPLPADIAATVTRDRDRNLKAMNA
jgi:hypothetical protein